MYWWFKKSIVFAYACSFMSFYFYFFKKLSPDVLYRGHSITYEWNIFFCFYIIFNALNNVKTLQKYNFFPKTFFSGLKRLNLNNI